MDGAMIIVSFSILYLFFLGDIQSWWLSKCNCLTGRLNIMSAPFEVAPIASEVQDPAAEPRQAPIIEAEVISHPQIEM